MRREFDAKLIQRSITDWGKVLILLLDEAAVIAVILLILHFLGIHVPLPIMIGGGIIIGISILIIHIAVIPSFRWKPVTGREGMIGVTGRVVKPLTPIGTVKVNGEYWRAESADAPVRADESVEIVGIEGLVLKVKREGSPLV
ncbi:NfeD family protein [Chloroflexota bacterium]